MATCPPQRQGAGPVLDTNRQPRPRSCRDMHRRLPRKRLHTGTPRLSAPLTAWRVSVATGCGLRRASGTAGHVTTGGSAGRQVAPVRTDPKTPSPLPLPVGRGNPVRGIRRRLRNNKDEVINILALRFHGDRPKPALGSAAPVGNNNSNNTITSCPQEVDAPQSGVGPDPSIVKPDVNGRQEAGAPAKVGCRLWM